MPMMPISGASPLAVGVAGVVVAMMACSALKSYLHSIQFYRLVPVLVQLVQLRLRVLEVAHGFLEPAGVAVDVGGGQDFLEPAGLRLGRGNVGFQLGDLAIGKLALAFPWLPGNLA